MLSDLRYAFRTLARNPGFAAIAVLTLALGIGATTAIFSVFNAVLLGPLPYAEPGRLVAIEEVVPKFARFGPSLPVTAWHFREWRKQSRAFEQFALMGSVEYTLTGGGDPLSLTGGRVSASLFPMLGIQARLGRTFREDEDQPGRDRVVVISDSLWNRRFRRDPAIVGTTISLSGQPFEVIGVLPAGIRVPSEGDIETIWRSPTETDFWKPFAIADSDLAIMAEYDYACVARLKPGVSRAQATADLNAIQAGIVRDLPEKPELRALLFPLQERMTGTARQSLTLLLAAAGLVLLMVVVNLANLLLARASARRRELAIRAAIGAGAGRIVRQMLTESLLLAAAGGALGVLLAQWALAAILVRAPLDLPGLKDTPLDATVLAFAALAAILSGLLFGILPAWRMARTDQREALKSGGRAVAEARHGGLRRLPVAAEVALCSLCLVVGGLLLTSFVRLLHVDKGFQTDRAIALNLSLPAARYPGNEKRTAFVETLLDSIQAVPSVAAAGVSNRGPLSGEGSNNDIYAEGTAGAAGERFQVDYRGATPGFFPAMGIPLRAGRLFRPADRGRVVAVISAQVARRVWPNVDPIGKRFHLGSMEADWIEVVGVAGDVRSSLNKAPNPTVYIPYWQLARPNIALVVRTAAAPMPIAGAVRAAIRGLDPELPAPRLRTLDDVVDALLAERRFQLTLVLIFALSALLLAVIGVYGVVSHTVARRTNEIGIRMALGASPSAVRLMVVRQGLAPVAAGMAAGLAGAVVAARLVSGFLFGVTPADPPTFAAVALLLLAAALAACYLPARRATRVDPLTALRCE